MGDVLAIPLHLAVHVGGFGFAAGLAAYGVVRRRDLGPTWLGLTVGAGLVALSSLVFGAAWADGLAWPLYVRAAGYAGIAFGLVGSPAGGLAAVAPAAPIAAHGVAAVAGGLAALAALGGSVGRGRHVVLLASGLALLAVGDLVVATRPLAGQVVALAGAALGLGWLAQRASRSLAYRFVTGFAAVLLVVILTLASAAAVVFDQELQESRLDRLGLQAEAQIQRIEQSVAVDLARSLEVLADSRDLPQSLLLGQADDDSAATVARLVPTADILVLADDAGRVVGSFDRATGQPLVQDVVDRIAGLGVLARTMELQAPAEELAGTEGAGGPELLAVATRPLFPTIDGIERRDRLAGVVVAASRVARADRVDTMARETGADVALLVDGIVVGATGPADDVRDLDLLALARQPGRHAATVGGLDVFAQSRDLRDGAGSVVGQLVLVEDAGVVGELQQLALRALFLAAIVGGVLATMLAAGVTARSVEPIRRLTRAAERMATGDLDVQVPGSGNDEVGRLAAAFGAMASSVQTRDQELRAAAMREGSLRERLEAVTGSMNEGLLAVDGDGAVTFANPAAARLLRADEDRLVGEPIGRVLVGTTDVGEPWATAVGAPDEPSVRMARGDLHVPGADPVTVAVTAAPLRADTGQPGRVVVVRDITDEAAVARAKDEFVSTAAHELRTPLTPVIGYLETLRRRPDLSKARRVQLVEDAAESAERLRRIVEQLVWFADLQVGRATVAPNPTPVTDLVDDVMARWRAEVPDRTFRRRVARGLPDVLVDPSWTGRALDELVSNAVKFSDDVVLVTAAPGPDGQVSLEVRDRGPGIDPAAFGDVRQPFRQVDGSTTRRFGGLGLGLAVVERIMEAQGAELRIDSEVGQGTHVRLRVPAAP